MLDLLIEGGEVIDGSGAPRWRADLGVRGGRIVALGALAGEPAHRRVDAAGLIVAPGFIDSHTHDDALVLQHPSRQPKLLQGVTTVVTGNCGLSLAPTAPPGAPPPLDLMSAGQPHFACFADYLDALDAAPLAINTLALVGHSSLRAAAMDSLDRPATPVEVERMRSELAQAWQAGAAGLSTGLYYPPARAATAQEVIEVARPLAGQGLISMHLRDEGDAIDAALAEAFAIGRALDVQLVLSHHKLMGPANHGRSLQTLALIEAASLQQRVCLDCYPYTASSTMLLPSRVAASKDVMISWSKVAPGAAGRLLSELAAEAGVAPVTMAERLQPGGAIYFAMADEDLERILQHPLAMIGSDGLPGEGHPHPRLWGSFPRVLGHYARERRLLTLETAVHKMTGLTARRFGLHGRGLIAAGQHADLTLFDPATVLDRATYEQPEQAPIGIRWVFVAGVAAVEQGEGSGARAGRLLRRGRVTQ